MPKHKSFEGLEGICFHKVSAEENLVRVVSGKNEKMNYLPSERCFDCRGYDEDCKSHLRNVGSIRERYK